MASLSGTPEQRRVAAVLSGAGTRRSLGAGKATKDVYRRAVEDATQQEGVDQPIPLSHANEAQTQNSPGVQLLDY